MNLLVTSNSEEVLMTQTVGPTVMIVHGVSKQLTDLGTINSRGSKP